MKIILIKLMIGVLRFIYAPMKMLPLQNKIVYLSRQGNEISLDMKLLSEEIKRNNPKLIQVFRLKLMEKSIVGLFEYVLALLGDMYHIATAKVVICDSYIIPVSCLKHRKELKVFQIWHALGAIKKFGLQSLGKKEGREEAVSKAMHMHENYDYVLAPSKATANFYKEAFGVSNDNILLCSLPRVDYLLEQTNRREELVRDNPRLRGKNIILYLPTFRTNEEHVVEDLDAMFRGDKKNALITSLHPLSGVRNKELYGIRGNFNTFDLMKCADAIVLDYSACAFEASVLEKKMFFYVPDYKNYDVNRGLNIDLKKEMSPYVFEDAFSLRRAIASEEYDFEKVRHFKETYVTETEACTKKLCEFICDLIEE